MYSRLTGVYIWELEQGKIRKISLYYWILVYCFWRVLQAAELQTPSTANLALVNLVMQGSIRAYNVRKSRLLEHKAWKVNTSQ